VKKKPPLVRGTEFSDDHRVHLLQGAEELFPALTEAMDAALSDIQFETYIFDFTGSGAAVAATTISASTAVTITQTIAMTTIQKTIIGTVAAGAVVSS